MQAVSQFIESLSVNMLFSVSIFSILVTVQIRSVGGDGKLIIYATGLEIISPVSVTSGILKFVLVFFADNKNSPHPTQESLTLFHSSSCAYSTVSLFHSLAPYGPHHLRVHPPLNFQTSLLSRVFAST